LDSLEFDPISLHFFETFLKKEHVSFGQENITLPVHLANSNLRQFLSVDVGSVLDVHA